MLDGKAIVKTQLVASRKFAPQLVVSLSCSHARFVPNMREVGEFHLTSSAFFGAGCRSLQPGSNLLQFHLSQEWKSWPGVEGSRCKSCPERSEGSCCPIERPS